jgi:hypothetical protein
MEMMVRFKKLLTLKATRRPTMQASTYAGADWNSGLRAAPGHRATVRDQSAGTAAIIAFWCYTVNDFALAVKAK